MRATLPYITQKFDDFNRLCFDGQLPPIKIVLSRARTYLGVCAYKTKRDFLGRKRYYDFRLRISTLFDLPEDELDDIILHEMIHYHIIYNRLRDTSSHGQLFRQIMDDLNRRFGRHITISHRLTPEQREKITNAHKCTHTVAVVRFHDGRTGIKVVPRSRERVVMFYHQLMSVPEIASVEFYISDNTFFNRYPTSTALKVYYLQPDELKLQLSDAKRWEHL